MGAIEDIYADLEADVSETEFREAVENKVEQMGGLADEETAALLVAHELSDQQVNAVADIEPGMEEVKFVAKVVSVGQIREFERDDAEDPGRVVNLELADETGRIRAAFWDEQAEAAVTDLEAGDVLRVLGRPKEGYDGVEVSVSRAELDEETEIDVEPDGPVTIEALSLGQNDVTLKGRVLETEAVRTFSRDDGSEGRVSNLVVGDGTGRVRVTLWDDKADLAGEFEPGESVEVIDGYVRDRDGTLELHVGDRGAIEAIDEDVEYVPDTTDIADLELGETVDIAGVIRSADPVRTFDRDDGSQGKVRNVRLQDQTGDIRVALWGEKADIELTPGDEAQFADVEIRDGWQEDLEASAGWRSTVTLLDEGSPVPAPTPTGGAGGVGSETGSADLSSFAGGTAGGDDGAGGDAAGPTEAPSGPTEFTGVVVQAGDPVILDDGERTVSLEIETPVELGQELSVRGRISEGRMDVEEVL